MISPSSIDLAALPSLYLSHRTELPEVSAIYFVIDSLNQIQYIGRSRNLKNRWHSHHRQFQLEAIESVRIAWLQCDDVSFLGEIEAALIEWFAPPLNGLRNNPESSNNGKLKSRLPDLMKEKGVDQKTVAAATGLSPTTVGKLYRSHFDRIDNHTVMALCKYFGLRKLDDLLELVWEVEDGGKVAH
jgi:excinuclease UvrABC nuclease subunit